MKNLKNLFLFLTTVLMFGNMVSFAQENDDMYFSASDRKVVKFDEYAQKQGTTYESYTGDARNYSSNYNGNSSREVKSELVDYYKGKAEETSNSYSGSSNSTMQNTGTYDGYYADDTYDYVSSDNTNGIVNNYYGPTYLSDPWYTSPGYAVNLGWGGFYPWRPVGWGFGWNSWSGWNVGFGFGWNSWGYYDPFWGPGWGWGGYGGWGWGNRWGGGWGWGGNCWNCYPGCGYGGAVVYNDRNVGLTNSSYYGPRYANRSTNVAGGGITRTTRLGNSAKTVGVVGADQSNERINRTTRSSVNNSATVDRVNRNNDTNRPVGARSEVTRSTPDKYREVTRTSSTPTRSTGTSGRSENTTVTRTSSETDSRAQRAQERYRSTTPAVTRTSTPVSRNPETGTGSNPTRSQNNVSRDPRQERYSNPRPNSGSPAQRDYGRTNEPVRSNSTPTRVNTSPSRSNSTPSREYSSPSRTNSAPSRNYSSPSRSNSTPSNSAPSRSYSAPSRSSSPSGGSSPSMRSSSPSRSSSPAGSSSPSRSGGSRR